MTLPGQSILKHRRESGIGGHEGDRARLSPIGKDGLGTRWRAAPEYRGRPSRRCSGHGIGELETSPDKLDPPLVGRAQRRCDAAAKFRLPPLRALPKNDIPKRVRLWLQSKEEPAWNQQFPQAGQRRRFE